MIGKVASNLITDKGKKLDKYGKNLIKYYDVINHVVSERKRKNNPQKDFQNLTTDINRKGAQSLFTNQTLLAENINSNQDRMRIESNYTVRSGDRVVDTSQDRCSLSAKKKKTSKNSKNSRKYSKFSNSKGTTTNPPIK